MACRILLASCLAAAAMLRNSPPPAEQSVTILVELVVQDAAGRPVTDLRLDEIEVVQEAERQRVRTFQALPRPGGYEITYVPASGKAAEVTVRVLRRGTQVRGPEGPFLKPRILVPLTPLEAELTDVLETRPQAADLACDLAVLRFEPSLKGVHHTVAVEVPLSDLQWSPAAGRRHGRLQILARIKGPDGRDSHMSSVVLLQPRGAVSLREELADDPLSLNGAALMPTLRLVLPVGAPGQARFFETLYPDPRSKEPVSLRLEVYRSGLPVGGVAIPLPAADATGEIRYVGAVPTQTFLDAPYALRLVARQDEAVVAEEASFTMTAHPEGPRLRFPAHD